MSQKNDSVQSSANPLDILQRSISPKKHLNGTHITSRLTGTDRELWEELRRRSDPKDSASKI